MKKKLFATGILMAGVLTLSPISMALNGLGNSDTKEDVMYASVATKENNYQQVDSIEDASVQTENTYNQNDVKHESVVESEVKDQQRPVETNQDQIINKSAKVNTKAQAKVDSQEVNVNNNNETKNAALSKTDAQNLLKEKYGSDVYYEYMGNEVDYGSIKTKGHEGYVYLPHKPTDMGYFVDKNTKEVYEFHPSGYFDLAE